MKCQICDDSIAAIKIAQVIDETKIEINLCKNCAKNKGIGNAMVTLPNVFDDFVHDLITNHVATPASSEHTHASCRECGMTWDDFQATGLFGCDVCYYTFKSDMNLVLRKIHGSHCHIGRAPKSQRRVLDKVELQRIQLELQHAIMTENFKLAAELRDVVQDAEIRPDCEEYDGILR